MKRFLIPEVKKNRKRKKADPLQSMLGDGNVKWNDQNWSMHPRLRHLAPGEQLHDLHIATVCKIICYSSQVSRGVYVLPYAAFQQYQKYGLTPKMLEAIAPSTVPKEEVYIYLPRLVGQASGPL